MIVFTDCKINIGLDILRKRADGYHDISTCMMHVPWHDIIEIIPAKEESSTLTVIGNKVDCPPEKNLVMKAYNKLKEAYSLPPVDIILQKIVPDGAGLGGGSADATYTLKALNEMFCLGICNERLAEIASSIGADCAFFAYDSPMIAEGIGEILRPIDLPLKGYTILIAKPQGVSISTKEAYAGVTPAQPEEPLENLLRLPIDQWRDKIKNDFEPGIFALAPSIARLKESMYRHGAIYASMSGSGASVFGIFESDKMADTMISEIKSLPHFKYTV